MPAVFSITEYDYFKANIDGGTAAGGAAMDWLSDTFKVALATTTYTPNLTTHDFFDDITNELAAGNGYTAGGETLASKTTSAPSAGVVARDCADVVWTFTATKDFRYAVIYKSTGVSSTSPLVCLIDITGAGNQTAPVGTWTLQFHATGLWTLT